MFGRILGVSPVSPRSQGQCPSGEYLHRAKRMRSPGLRSCGPVGTILGQGLKIAFGMSKLWTKSAYIQHNRQYGRKESKMSPPSSEMTHKIQGIIPVMLTPFTDQGEIDYPGLERLIEWYLEKGADALFAVCQSSEMQFLTAGRARGSRPFRCQAGCRARTCNRLRPCQ